MQEKIRIRIAAYAARRWHIRPRLIATHTGLPWFSIATATKRPTDGVTDDQAREMLTGIYERLSYQHLAVCYLKAYGKDKLKEMLPCEEYLKVIITANDRLKKLTDIHRRRQAESLSLPSRGERVRRLTLESYLQLIIQCGYHTATKRISKATNPDYAQCCVHNAMRAGINKEDLFSLKTKKDYEKVKDKAIRHYWQKRGVVSLETILKKIYYGEEKKRNIRFLTENILSVKEINACKTFEQFEIRVIKRTWEKISNRKASKELREIKTQTERENTTMKTPESFMDFCLLCHKQGYDNTLATLEKHKRNAYRRLLLAGDGAGFESLTGARAFFKSKDADYESFAGLRVAALLFRRVNLAKWPEPIRLRKGTIKNG